VAEAGGEPRRQLARDRRCGANMVRGRPLAPHCDLERVLEPSGASHHRSQRDKNSDRTRTSVACAVGSGLFAEQGHEAGAVYSG
jgi:hypothetical protein